MRHTLSIPLTVLLFAGALAAQDEACEIPPATLGSPYVFHFGEGLDGLESIEGFEFSFTFGIDGGTLPPGVSIKPNGLVSGTPTAAGSFNFSLKWTFIFRIEGEPPFDFSASFPCRLQVLGGGATQISVEPGGLTFAYVQGGAAQTQVLAVSNRSTLSRTFSASASTSSGGNWISLSASGGSAPPFSVPSLGVSANPGSLGPGIYAGAVTVTISGVTNPFVIPVTMSISGGQQAIQLSQSGVTFRAVQGVPLSQTQSFSVLNAGTGALNWTASASTLSGGSSWLSASPASGRSDSTASPGVDVQVNPQGLTAGDYYGQVQVVSTGVTNSPQSISVVLSVLAPEANPAPLVLPTGLIFVGSAGGANPAPQNVRVSNLSGRTITFGTGRTFETPGNWFSTTVLTGSVAPAQTLNIPVQVALASLAAGVYRGELSVRFNEDQSLRRIDVLLIVTPRVGSAARRETARAPFADGCTPARLLPVFTQLGSGFKTTAAWPTPIEVRVVDDCGTPIAVGSVVTTFSSGEQPSVLTSLRDGRWAGTWSPRGAAAQVTVTAQAQTTSPRLEGSAQIGGGADPNLSTPAVSTGGVVNAAVAARQAPVAPGSLIAIYGARLTPGQGQLNLAPSLPLPTELAGTQVFVGGQRLPLVAAVDSQVNAMLPYDLPVNTSHQVIVKRGLSYSVPETVTVASTGPAVFGLSSGGAITRFAADGSQPVVTPGNPAAAGDVITVYCTGLGAVNPPVAAGAPAPSAEPLARTASPVTLTIGGREANVLYSGLTPGATGLYQINATVPEGIVAGPTVRVTVTVGGQSSEAVTMAIK